MRRSAFGWGVMDGVELAQMLRPTCCDCGRDGLLYGHVSELMVRVTPQMRQSFAEGIEWLGDSPDPVAWACPACGGLGLFSDVAFS